MHEQCIEWDGREEIMIIIIIIIITVITPKII